MYPKKQTHAIVINTKITHNITIAIAIAVASYHNSLQLPTSTTRNDHNDRTHNATRETLSHSLVMTGCVSEPTAWRMLAVLPAVLIAGGNRESHLTTEEPGNGMWLLRQ
jgi:hypothetical protein